MTNDRFLRKLWISLGIIVVGIAAAAAGISYYINDLSAQADTIVSDRDTVAQQTAAVADLASLQQSLPQAVQYQVAMNQLLPNQYGLVTFGPWLAQLGQQYGVTTNTLFEGSPAATQGAAPGVVDFSFNAEGPSSGITAFLDEMVAKSSGFLITLDSFNYTNDGTSAKVTGAGMVFFQ